MTPTLRPLLGLVATLLAGVTSSPLRAQNAQVLWSNPWSNAATVSSRVWSSPASDLEAADDFDVQGTITRVVMDGTGCFSCSPPVVAGATVRFYDWANGTPGALRQQAFVPAGSPALRYTPAQPATVDVDLPQPFVATGRHFVSVQLHFTGGGYWDVWVANPNNPTLANVLVRDRLGSNTWAQPTVYPWPSPPIFGDLTFQLWGLPPGVTTQPAIPCVTWSPTAIAAPPGSTHSLLTDAVMFAVDDVWAVGRTQVPANPGTATLSTVMHWDGLAWTQVPSPSPNVGNTPPGVWLAAIGGTGSNDVWVGGSWDTVVNGGWFGPQVFAMHWDGQQWSIPTLPVPNTSLGAGINGSGVSDIVALASNDVWLVGDWLDLLSAANPQTIRPGLLLHWDGSALQQTILPIVTGVGHQYLEAVAASATNDVWAVGGAGTSRLPGSTVPVVFHFDGSGWTHRPCPVPPGRINLYDVEVTGPNDVMVFGTATVSSTPLPTVTRFMAHWNGASWSLLPGPPGGIASKAFGANDAWSAGNEVWHWDGQSWSQQFDVLGSASGTIAALEGFGPCVLVGVGGRTQNGVVAPFAARQDNDQLWRTRLRTALLPDRAPATLRALSAVRPGAPLRVGVDAPIGLLTGTTATAFWALGLQALPPGIPLGFGGRNGGPGEILIDPLAVGHLAGPATLRVGQGPAPFVVQVPNAPALVGMDLFTQGMLLDGGATFGAFFTNALDLHVGW